MKPIDYELSVASYFSDRGYKVSLTPQSGDYGIDVIAEKDGERIAVQAKMYKDTARKVNRATIMELSGAMQFAECTSAALVTNGRILPDAELVAAKLGIAIIYFDPDGRNTTEGEEQPSESPQLQAKPNETESFDRIWKDYVMPLEGKTIELMSGETNRLLQVDWGGVRRITKNGRENQIPIEPFRFAVTHLLTVGKVTAQDILDSDKGRYSRGVFAILARVPIFDLERTTPPVLRYRRK